MATNEITRHNSKKLISSPNDTTCTYQQTKTSYEIQPFYRCRSCFTGLTEGVCNRCVDTCHKGHSTVFAGTFSAYCDCGLVVCKSSCKIGTKCTFDLYGKVNRQQDWFQCHTCWGGESQFGCCEVCAEECHKGHKIVYKELSKGAVCDCGDNRHKSEVCTFHVTGNQLIIQPFYTCTNCFSDSNRGCCYQCMKVCHAGHRTVRLGTMKAFCDCGLKCCKTSCKIQKP